MVCRHLHFTTTMIKYLKLPFAFDPEKLKYDLPATGISAWKPHHQVLHYTGDWSALSLRSLNGETDNIYISPVPDPVYSNTPLLEASAYYRYVLSFFQCPLLSVRLLKLKAGAIILEHRDADLCFEKGEARFHIPIVTNPDVEFILEGERIHLHEGECWYMNFNLPHSIANKSHADRVHLVIDARVNDWVKEIFNRPGLQKKEIEEPGYDDETKKKIIAQLRAMNTEKSNQLANEMESAIPDE